MTTPERTQKYSLNQRCDWCSETDGVRAYVLEKRGTKDKRMGIEVTACGPCARRMQLEAD